MKTYDINTPHLYLSGTSDDIFNNCSIGVYILSNELDAFLKSQMDMSIMSQKLRVDGKNSDSVYITSRQLWSKMVNMEITIEDYIRPALSDFVIFEDIDTQSIKNSKLSRYNKVWFSKTYLKSFKVVTKGDGELLYIYPYTDIIMNNVYAIAGVILRESDKKSCLFTSLFSHNRLNKTIELDLNNDDSYKEIMVLTVLHYSAIQQIFKNKPELLINAQSSVVKEISGKRIEHKSKKKNNKKNGVKIVKRVIIHDGDVVTPKVKAHREILCPSWGVVGHWRTYKKTGKRVWVAPYRKGKQRDNPNIYKAKDYHS